jgi:hypothetical protein
MNRQISILVAVAVLSLATAGCGHYPSYIRSTRSIGWTSSSEGDLVILSLPLEDWPKLQKFQSVMQFRIRPESPSQINDDHIGAFSRLKMPLLRQVGIDHCPNVTDNGILALTNFPSIVGLGLGGVGITDRGMRTLATGLPHLRTIGIEECPSVTVEGFLSLTNSRTITTVGLSLDHFSREQIEGIISTVTNVTWWIISDPRHRLDPASLRQLGESRNITIEVADENKLVMSITMTRQTGSANSIQPLPSETNRGR